MTTATDFFERLSRIGWAPREAGENRLREFAAAFSIDGEAGKRKFLEFFESETLTHECLVAFAAAPLAGPLPEPGEGRARPCPLCRFPSFELIDGERLPAEVTEEISSDFPGWQSRQGVCRQCADLYSSCRMSQAAEAALPRV